MEIQLRALLIAGLSGMSASRINWGQHMADAARPYIVMSLIDMNEGMTMQGPDGLERSRVQIDCYAPDMIGATETGRAVKALLNGHRDGPFRLIMFSAMRNLREGGAGSLQGGANGGEAIYRASLDFIIHWRNDHAG